MKQDSTQNAVKFDFHHNVAFHVQHKYMEDLSLFNDLVARLTVMIVKCI